MHDERLISDLRLEIMGVQEDVRRESESEASSAHSPLEYHSQLCSNRYQVALLYDILQQAICQEGGRSVCVHPGFDCEIVNPKDCVEDSILLK